MGSFTRKDDLHRGSYHLFRGPNYVDLDLLKDKAHRRTTRPNVDLVNDAIEEEFSAGVEES